MIDLDKTTIAINKALDFKRDNEIGYMLTDLDIINGIVIAEYNTNVSFEEAEMFLKNIRIERKKVV
jgi:hypothetical protein